MTVPVRFVPCFVRVAAPLLVIAALDASTPCWAEPPATSRLAPFKAEVGAPEFDLYPADPLVTSPAVPQRLPRNRRSALHEDSPVDWAQRIDRTWGPSPWTIPQMLGMFDTFWDRVDRGFACFQGLDVGAEDWVALRESAHAEISAGVSRGRFVAIMNHLAFALRVSHTSVRNYEVNNSPLLPGVPLFVVGGWGDNRHFGAGLTPLPDGSLLVYKTMPNHPLGLVPGDIVLGYGGVPWERIYRRLLAAQLPLAGWWSGSSESSWTHSMLMSAGLNWHLFDTIDVVKHATGATVHLPLAPLASTARSSLDCTEQLPVPGVPMPDYLGSNDPVSWGIVEGTQVGYVYVRAWSSDAGAQILDAVQTLLTQHETTGLIFDFRTNYGGNMFLAYPALSLLFDHNVPTLAFAQRCGYGDYLTMCPSSSGNPDFYVIHGTAAADYDRPIAVLVGPGAISSGELVAKLFRFHPQARFFGKSTASAFNAGSVIDLGVAGWGSAACHYDAYGVADPTDYLTHNELGVDHDVWLTPGDVAQGKDTVVEAALRWINESPAGNAVHATIDRPPDHKLATVTIEGSNVYSP